MRLFIFSIVLLTAICAAKAQPNCNVFLWKGDTLQYEACKYSQIFRFYYQFDTEAIAVLDSCIALCPYYAFPYYEKAVVYLKAGNPIGWDKYINLAVKYDPISYLGTRASCRGKFFADYEGAISDIDSLDTLVDYDIGYIHDGMYHLNVYKGICYKVLGNYTKAIEVIQSHIDAAEVDVGLYDYIHLGVAYQAIGEHKQALECFKKQETINDVAENHYYAALSYQELEDAENFSSSITRAKEMLDKGQQMSNKYHILEDEIFMTDVEALMK